MEKGIHSLWQNIKRVLSDTWRFDKKLYGLTAAFMAATAVIGLTEVYIIKFLVDELMGQKRAGILVLLIAVAALVLLFARLTLSFVNSKHWYRLVMVRMKYLFKRSGRLMEMPFQACEDPKVLDVLEQSRFAVSSYISAYNAGVELFLKTLLLGFFAQIPLLFSYIGILAAFSPLMLGLIILTVTAEYILHLKLSKAEHKMREKTAPAMRRMNYFSESVTESKFGSDIRIYSLSGLLLSKYDVGAKQQMDAYKPFTRGQITVNLTSLVISTVRYGLISVFLFYSVKYYGLSIGDYSMLLGAAIAFSAGMSALIRSAADLVRENLSISNYFKFMNLNSHDETGKKQAPLTNNHSLEFQSVSFAYPGSKVSCIENFSLKIPSGQRIALVGVNGAGKTTLIKLLTGLYKPTGGRILIDGQDMAELEPRQRFKLFSVVFQEINMFAWSFEENVSLCEEKYINKEKMKEAVRDAGLEDCVKSLKNGYKTHISRAMDEDGQELSGGQAQRLALARAIYKDGPILILDEPTSALDPIAESKIYESFNKLMDGKTGIYVSHRLSSTGFCDKIVFLQGGKLLEYGSHKELMDLNGSYADMFKKQSHYYKEEGASI